jgi:hypothetical protein
VEPVEGPHGDGLDPAGAGIGEEAVEDGPGLRGALDLLVIAGVSVR